MAHKVLISALTKKYAELLGELRSAEREIETVSGHKNIQEATDRIDRKKAELRIDLDHIAAVAKLFDPAWDRRNVKARMPRAAPLGGRGEIIRTVIRILVDAGIPLSSREIAGRMFPKPGTRPPECDIDKIDISIRAAMKRYAKEGLVELHPGSPMRWSVVRRDRAADHAHSQPATISAGPGPAS